MTAAVANIIVRTRRLRVMGVVLMPHGVEFRIRAIRGTIAKLVPMLRATRSMLSSSFFGKRVLIRL